MKKELAVAVSAALTVGILSPEERPHIHKELLVPNTTSETTVVAIRLIIPGGGYADRRSQRN
jgi:hypothetical protein